MLIVSHEDKAGERVKLREACLSVSKKSKDKNNGFTRTIKIFIKIMFPIRKNGLNFCNQNGYIIFQRSKSDLTFPQMRLAFIYQATDFFLRPN